MGELDCQGSFIPTVVAPCLSLIGETEQEEMGLKGLLEGEGTARVGPEPTGWRIWMKFIQGQGFPGGSDGNESACSAGDPGLIPGLGRSPGEGNGYPTPVFLSGEFHGQRSPVGYRPWGWKELDTTEQLAHTQGQDGERGRVRTDTMHIPTLEE